MILSSVFRILLNIYDGATCEKSLWFLTINVSGKKFPHRSSGGPKCASALQT